MKKIDFNIKTLFWALLFMILVTLCFPCFEAFQRLSADKTELILGFPFNFYTIKQTAMNTFAVHFNVAGFLANFAVFYVIVLFFEKIYDKVNGKRRKKDE